MMDYTLIRSLRKTLGLQVKDGEVIVRAPLFVSKRTVNAFVLKHEAWIRKQLAKSRAGEGLPALTDPEKKALADQARRVIPQRVAYYAKLIGVDYGRITIRTQKTRWGSCSSKGNLNFNCLLMLAPEYVRDYVVVHELCHLKEMNHSKAFYREIEKILPDYRDRIKELKSK